MPQALIHPDVIIASDSMVFVGEDVELLPADAPSGAGRAGSYGGYLRKAIDEVRLSMAQIPAPTSTLNQRCRTQHGKARPIADGCLSKYHSIKRVWLETEKPCQ
ncbi:hypothetical protein SAMN02745866_04055 [Alteromonadaceae bacterium Bs31]|nr:hypothetical protein SAMN02745866_04055 [Alteromonadaceae bacterium Bs31]